MQGIQTRFKISHFVWRGGYPARKSNSRRGIEGVDEHAVFNGKF
jgi:hypothetical protein